jgi:hypothetical protein
MTIEAGLTKFQALFRGKRCRETHVERVRQGLRKFSVFKLINIITSQRFLFSMVTICSSKRRSHTSND